MRERALPESHLEFGVSAQHHKRQVSDGAGLHHGLGQFRRVFADVTERRGGDAFEGHLRLLKTQHQQGPSSCIQDSLSQSCMVQQSTKIKEARRFETVCPNKSCPQGKEQVCVSLQALCRAMQPRAQAAASFTPGSNSSRQRTRASTPPQPTTSWESSGECLATARSTNAAAFL